MFEKIKQFGGKVKDKIKATGAWVKRNIKKVIVLAIGGSIVLAAGLPTTDTSFQDLPNVSKEAGLYRITYDEYSDVEISDKDMPEVKLRKWGEETFIKISYPDFTPVNPKQGEGKLKWENGNKEVHLYPTKVGETDAFEFEIILKSKPATNKITLDIETKGLKFYYQPPLNQEKQEEGLTCSETECKDKDGNVVVHRPENVVGSYAVYHESKTGNYEALGGKNYRAGKAFPIYRPEIIDSAGNWIWGEYNKDVQQIKKLIITIPQEFLDNAVYPVRVDPTFGCDPANPGESSQQGSDHMYGSIFTLSVNGDTESVSVYCNPGNYYSWGYGIYDSSQDHVADNHTTAGGSTPVDWYTLTIITNLPAADYWLILWEDINFPFYYDSGASNQGMDNSLSYSTTWPSSFGGTKSNRKYSIYCTYTPGGGEEAPRRRGQIISYLNEQYVESGNVDRLKSKRGVKINQ